jgi:hypothetical protein
MAAIPTLPNYNINPPPQTGQGDYGSVPGAIGLPPSTYSQVGGVLPNLPGLTATAGNVVGSDLAGQLPGGTIGQIQDAAAVFGVGSGMPGSGLQANRGAETLGLSAWQLQQQGLQNYQSLIPTIGSTLLSPDLISNIAMQNAVYGAAPDPQAAASTLEELAGGGGNGRPGLSIGGGGGTKSAVSLVTPVSPAAAATPGTTTGTATGGIPYGNDQWYYGGQIGPGNAPPTSVGLPNFQTGTATADQTAGIDTDYYSFLVGAGLMDPFADVGPGVTTE